jgi:hypothetical protein
MDKQWIFILYLSHSFFNLNIWYQQCLLKLSIKSFIHFFHINKIYLSSCQRISSYIQNFIKEFSLIILESPLEKKQLITIYQEFNLVMVEPFILCLSAKKFSIQQDKIYVYEINGELMCFISLATNATKWDSCEKVILDEEMTHHIHLYYLMINEKNTNKLRELFFGNLGEWKFPDIFYDNPMIGNYDDDRYLYYPCLDVAMHNDEIDIIDQSLNSPIFNTNGFYVKSIQTNQDAQSRLIKRFDDKYSGIWMKKHYLIENRHLEKIEVIPRHFHFLWLENISEEPYSLNWRRLLKNAWNFHYWSIKELKLIVFKPETDINRWEDLFYQENDINLKRLIAALAILEQYGGMLVDGEVIPLKHFPYEMLRYHFIVCFQDEFVYGTRISFRFMASRRGERIFDDLYLLLSSRKDKIWDALNELLLHHPLVTIYPSYFFHSTYHDLPLFLSKNALCIVKSRNDVILQEEKEGKEEKVVKKNLDLTLLQQLSFNEKN